MRKNLRRILILDTVAFLAFAGAALAKPPATCDATAVATARATIDDVCPCAAQSDGTPWKNHGQYVKCVTKARKAAAASVQKKCLKEVVPCAAQSTCGKSADIACVITTTATGSCQGDPIQGDTLKEGTCVSDPTVACDTDADCSQSTCSAMSQADCTTAGGSPAVGPCCSQ